MQVSREEVAIFLGEFHPVVEDGNIQFHSHREKNAKFLSTHGLTESDLLFMLKNLLVEEYSKGPLEDRNNPLCNMWIFGPDFCNNCVYVKIADCQRSGMRFRCVSFHDTTTPVNLPYKV